MARILLMDDDETVRTTLAVALERAGHEVRTARDGRKGLEALGAFPADLVITDINMPEMDGIEVVAELRSGRPELPIIAISGGGKLPKELLLEDAGHFGALHTVTKPIDFAVLLRAVDSVLAPKVDPT